jgi:hypothetical protein
LWWVYLVFFGNGSSSKKKLGLIKNWVKIFSCLKRNWREIWVFQKDFVAYSCSSSSSNRDEGDGVSMEDD